MSINIENIGEDVYTLMARGHHDPHEFMRQVREEGYDWPLGMPQHLYCKTVPTRKDGYNCWYSITKTPQRGSYPVTYVSEAWGDDQYKASPTEPKE